MTIHNITPPGARLATGRGAAAVLVLWTAAAGCGVRSRGEPSAPAPVVLGNFLDDYGGRHQITPSEWRQGARNRYHIVRWNGAAQYLVARNDTGNAGEGGRWTRIDWMPLTGMAPWTWAFCLSAFNAPSADSAERTTIARRDTPRTGCNGYPFSRMRPAAP